MRAIIIGLLTIVYVYANSQEIMNLRWGAYQGTYDIDESFYYLGLWKEDSVSEMFLHGDRVEIFDKQLHLTQNISMKSLFAGAKIITGYSDSVENVFVVQKKDEVYWQSFNRFSMEFSAPFSNFDFKDSRPLFSKYSQDSSCIILYAKPDVKNNNLKCIVASKKGKKVWEASIVCESKVYGLNEPFISNSKDVLVIDNNKEDINITLWKGNADSPVKLNSKTLNNKITGAKAIFFDNIWRIIIAYNKDNVNFECMSYFQLLEINNNGVLISDTVLDINECNKSALLIDLLNENNMLYVISELFATTKNNASNQISYGTIYVDAIDLSSKNFKWHTSIFKNHYSVVDANIVASPYTVEYNELHGHKSIDYNGFLYFVYNDNCNNCKLGGTLSRSHADINKSCVNMVRVNKETGKLNQFVYPAFNGEKYNISIDKSIINTNRLFLLSKNSQYRLGKLVLPQK